MDLKINREMLTVSESIFDGIQEQSVELDYILPDYFPDIFKLVKCCIVPSVLSYSINGDTVSYELQADIKILYCSEQSNTLQCICQKMTFNKSIQLSETAEKPSVTLVPKTDHINCRVVNQRRIDMRGAVSIKIKITGERTQEVICDIFGMNAQMKKLPVEFAAKKISAFKSISASEDFELNSSNQPVISIIRTYSVINVTDKKIVANKLVLKGEASVCVLYSCENGLESMKFPVPFSQIVDMDCLDESFTCSVKAETASCDVTASADSNGDARILKCELRINVSCSAVKNLPAELVTDVYSTSFPCEFASSRLKIEQAPVEINELIQEKLTIESENGNVECVYDTWCVPKNINTAVNNEEKTLVVSGMIDYCVMIKNETGMPAIIEKTEAFEHTIPVNGISETSSADINVTSVDCSYTITSSDSISIKADLRITGNVFLSSSCEAVTEVNFDGSVKKVRDGDYALKLYYGVEGEDIWEIAKRYSTSVRSIMEENDLDEERLTKSGMLLIPIV